MSSASQASILGHSSTGKAHFTWTLYPGQQQSHCRPVDENRISSSTTVRVAGHLAKSGLFISQRIGDLNFSICRSWAPWNVLTSLLVVTELVYWQQVNACTNGTTSFGTPLGVTATFSDIILLPTPQPAILVGPCASDRCAAYATDHLLSVPDCRRSDQVALVHFATHPQIGVEYCFELRLVPLPRRIQS